MVTKHMKNTPTKPIRLSIDIIDEIKKQAIYGETTPNQVLRRVLNLHKTKNKQAKATQSDKEITDKLR